MGRKSKTSSSRKKEGLEFMIWSDDVFLYEVLVHRRLI